MRDVKPTFGTSSREEDSEKPSVKIRASREIKKITVHTMTRHNKAAHCTLEDGPGVLQARGLLPLVNDTIFLDDNQCIPLEERGKKQISKTFGNLLVSVMPNPTNTGWYVQSTSPGMLRYNLFSSGGRLVSSGNLTEEVVWIGADRLETGLYFLYIIDQDGVTQMEKLQLIR